MWLSMCRPDLSSLVCRRGRFCFFFFSSRRRHTRCSRDWSSDVCSSDLRLCEVAARRLALPGAQAPVPALPCGERRPRRGGARSGRGGDAGRAPARGGRRDPARALLPGPGAPRCVGRGREPARGHGTPRPRRAGGVRSAGRAPGPEPGRAPGDPRARPRAGGDRLPRPFVPRVVLRLRQRRRGRADDDTACQIKTDNDVFKRLEEAVDGANRALTAGKDTTSSTAGKIWKFAQALQKLFTAIASLINTNDELVGNAVQDSIVGEYHPGFNWIVKGEQNATTGWITLEMK